MRRVVSVAAVAGVMLVGGTQMATAAPPEPEVFPLVCDDGSTHEVVVNGNGTFTPGRVMGSTRVFVPVTIGNFSFTAVLPDGTVISDTFPETETKGGGNVAARNPRPVTSCTFEVSDVLGEDDPEFGFPAGTELTFGGEVTGYLTGR